MARKRFTLGGLSQAATLGFKGPEAQRAIPNSKLGEPLGQLESNRTQMSTLFTKIGETRQLLPADGWLRVTMQLETAGPVVVGTKNALQPITNGQGILLTTAQPFTFVLSKGDRLYYAANAVNRVSVLVEPIPWLQQLALQVAEVTGAIGSVREFLRQAVGARMPPAPITMPTDAQLRRVKVRGKR